MKEIDWMRSASMVNTVSFLSYALDEYQFSKNTNLQTGEKKSIQYSAILLAIAGVHYAILDVSRPSVKTEILIRYSDWLLTTPLLLMVIASLYELPRALTVRIVIYDIVMILTGLIYEFTGSIAFWSIGTIAYLMILKELYQNLPELDLFYKYFVVGWAGYGFIALLPPKDRLLYFNVLDFYNKLIFALDVRRKIDGNIVKRSLSTNNATS